MIFSELIPCFHSENFLRSKKYWICIIYFYFFNNFNVFATTISKEMLLEAKHERERIALEEALERNNYCPRWIPYKAKSPMISSLVRSKTAHFSFFSSECFEHVGCFYSGPPFFNFPWRLFNLLPQRNVTINFALYTPKSTINSYNISLKSLNNDSISDLPFNSSFPTMILIPGFLVDYKPEIHSELFKIKDEVLKYYSYNVIVVDWTRSNNFPYAQAIANGRLVGAYIAYFLKLIEEIKGINYDEVHLVGHSLGAHVAGWAGERINKIGRITGLDPAGPYFEYAPDAVRLDTTDAKFVDIIHTNGADTVLLGYGLYQQIGDVDFYPNGGYSQPECESKYDILQIFQERSCDHSIAMDYFRASIHSCRFTSVSCKNNYEFENGKCTKNNSITDEMGFYAKPIPNKTEVTFYLKTTSTYPFC